MGPQVGRLFVPGGGEGGSDFEEDLSGTWELSGTTLRLDHAAETFLRDMVFSLAGTQLRGDETFGSVTVRVALSK